MTWLHNCGFDDIHEYEDRLRAEAARRTGIPSGSFCIEARADMAGNRFLFIREIEWPREKIPEGEMEWLHKVHPVPALPY